MGDCLSKRQNKFLFQKHFFVSEINSLNMPLLIPRMFSSSKMFSFRKTYLKENIPIKFFGVRT